VRASADSFRFQPQSIRKHVVSVIIANHSEPFQAKVRKLFWNVAKNFSHPYGQTFAFYWNLHDLPGYDGYDIRMYCSLKTTYASYSKHRKTVHVSTPKPFRSLPLG
jgi:hypothetical protein